MTLSADLIFATPLLVLPEFSESDTEAEFQKLYLRSQITRKFNEGQIDAETYLDCLDEHGYDIDYYLQSVESNLDFVVSNQIEIE